MFGKLHGRSAPWAVAAIIIVAWPGQTQSAEDITELKKQFQQLQQQNEQLQQQLGRHQELMESLQRKIRDIEGASERREKELDALKAETKEPRPSPGLFGKPFSFGNVILGGEAGLAFFHQNHDGQFRNAEFIVNEAKLFADAKLWEDIYFFTELNIVTREEPFDFFRLGELYVDWENVSLLWQQERQVNLRLGRFNTPFGEEYLTRDAVDNPLISHSVSDFWGVDEGIELYGSAKKFQYVLAVQNGSHARFRDFDADKAVIARLGYDATPWLHLGASAMRTGNLDVRGDVLSELWLGRGFVRALGSTNTTTKFHADLAQGDVHLHWDRGSLHGAGGILYYDDNDTAADNRRKVYFYSVEGTYKFTGKFYGATRFSHIMADEGFPIVGNGVFASRFFGNLTEDLRRLSLGLGYRWSPNLVLKVEYSFDRGRELGGKKRDNEDLFGIEMGLKF